VGYDKINELVKRLNLLTGYCNNREEKQEVEIEGFFIAS
jgi:hypothetical protein